MVVCSRCAGVFAGIAVGAIAPLPRSLVSIGRALVLGAVGLAALDVITQDLGLHAPFHPTRLATGVLLGYSATAFLFATLAVEAASVRASIAASKHRDRLRRYRARDVMIGAIRFPLRTAGFVGVTFGMYGLLELDTVTAAARDREGVLHKWIERYGRALLRLYGVEAIARGPYVERGLQYPGTDERGRGRIFVMNHRSGLDVALTLAHVEATIVSRADSAGWPVIGVAARRSGPCSSTTDKRSGAAVISAMCGALERGRAVMVYPEGTTFADDEVRPFRAGAFSAAERTGAEVVPIGIAYDASGAAFLADEPFASHMKRVSATARTRVGLVVGAPMRTSGSVDELKTAAREAVQALVHEARALVERAR